jgi:hypothetical protein
MDKSPDRARSSGFRQRDFVLILSRGEKRKYRGGGIFEVSSERQGCALCAILLLPTETNYKCVIIITITIIIIIIIINSILIYLCAPTQQPKGQLQSEHE